MPHAPRPREVPARCRFSRPLVCHPQRGTVWFPSQHFYSQVLDAPRTVFSSKHIIRRRPWASPCLFLLFLMSLSWLNCVPHQNHVSVTALAARARGCDCVWREGLKGGDEGTRSRDRPSPSVAGDLYQNRQGHRHMEGWVCGPGTIL